MQICSIAIGLLVTCAGCAADLDGEDLGGDPADEGGEELDEILTAQNPDGILTNGDFESRLSKGWVKRGLTGNISRPSGSGFQSVHSAQIVSPRGSSTFACLTQVRGVDTLGTFRVTARTRRKSGLSQQRLGIQFLDLFGKGLDGLSVPAGTSSGYHPVGVELNAPRATAAVKVSLGDCTALDDRSSTYHWDAIRLVRVTN